MLKTVEVKLSLVSCLLYEESFSDDNHFLVSWAILLDMSWVFGHTWPYSVVLGQVKS